ncbi:cysteine rich repeat-containing protein [Methylobacterium haplocladii]|uniref:3',5'-cyclic-nucleotide phosphodiesterase n=1 Tax=Methylobacterium haplocladii TaxID=1176176 RepID=A0A512IVN5_9HYPH|nr:cysteine rich repeat-containing protein [Methylobacterium haplocladii]GEP01733.1 hypothetical protein MHA02_41200 [Methylobacterium haplocladii]GJD85330.1 hypothetical protein HPGCJGGD_3218 [Methylobacterium haplocladii]GLS59399.1 hypothetical protein GCM10007887_20650 [Methylobacterium haplocladii]
MRHSLIVLGLIATVATPSLATAESMRGNPDLKKYCTGDALSFCSGIDADDPAMDACFKKNLGQMSENCRRAVTAYEATQTK